MSAEKDAHDARCERVYTDNGFIFIDCLCSLRRAQAKAWDEGHEEGCANPHGCPHLDDNPYREVRRPCGGMNSNICAAEGCYGQACLTTPPARDPYGNPVFSAQHLTAPKSPAVVRHRTRNPRTDR